MSTLQQKGCVTKDLDKRVTFNGQVTMENKKQYKFHSTGITERNGELGFEKKKHRTGVREKETNSSII